MSADALFDEPDFVMLVDALPKDGLHRVSIAAGGLGAGIPSALIATGIENALRVCGWLNRRLGHCRPSSAAFAARCRREGRW